MPADPMIEHAYREAVDRMTPAQKFERMLGLLAWGREIISSEIQRESGPHSAERLKWELASRLYGQSKQLGPLIENELRRVSH